MFKILLALLLLTTSAWATQWRAGTAEQTILGSSNAALIGYNSYNSIVAPLDNFISNQCNEYLQYASSSTMTVHSGVCVVSSNAATPVRLILMDTGNTTITSANLDTGSIQASTTYYVYSTAASNSATTSTYYISASNTAPSGATYYYQIGSFTTDASSQFTGIINNTWDTGYVSGNPVSKSANVVYQALTDGFLVTTGVCGGNPSSAFEIYSDSLSTPVYQWGGCGSGSTTTSLSTMTVPIYIRKGNYYKIGSSGSSNATGAWLPIGK